MTDPMIAGYYGYLKLFTNQAGPGALGRILADLDLLVNAVSQAFHVGNDADHPAVGNLA